MNLLSFQKFKNKKISPLGLIKIIIIILVSVYLIGEFLPFYLERGDDSLYGFGAIQIVNGSYEYTNEFLLNTEYKEFYFGPFIKTIHNTLIPNGAIGIYGLAAFSYFLGGYYALFYLGPIITILFLIIEEPVTVIYHNIGKTSTKDPISHSASVVTTLIELVAIKQPLRYLGIPGFILTIVGIIFSFIVIALFNESRYFSLPNTLVALGSFLLGVLLLLMSAVLYSINRGTRYARTYMD